MANSGNPAQPISKAELDDLDKLKALIEQAISDGILTAAEKRSLEAAIFADGKVSPEELELMQALVWDKLSSGELKMDWSV
ncbi:MAG: hypothetical protein HC812_03325 [Leptolyngbya sp. RL_3_1]|nr:hypothetical protein [Leptolyngbya sp. RL_3_1]